MTFLDVEVPVPITSGSLEKANNSMTKISVSSERDHISVADPDFKECCAWRTYRKSASSWVAVNSSTSITHKYVNIIQMFSFER